MYTKKTISGGLEPSAQASREDIVCLLACLRTPSSLYPLKLYIVLTRGVGNFIVSFFLIMRRSFYTG